MPRLSRLVASALLLGSFHLIAGCNAVLGIEPAELDDTVGLSQCHWPPADPTIDCHDDACEACADTCDVEGCFGDLECRKKLRDYRKCVGDSCDDKKSQCRGCLSDNAKAAALLSCMDQKCPSCGPAQSATLCESYCSCMDQKCREDEIGGSYATCLQACSSDPSKFGDWQTFCRWDHCERAKVPNDKFHCHHAADLSASSSCMTPPMVDETTATCKYPLIYSGAACNGSTECCSKSCNPDRGVCD